MQCSNVPAQITSRKPCALTTTSKMRLASQDSGSCVRVIGGAGTLIAALRLIQTQLGGREK